MKSKKTRKKKSSIEDKIVPIHQLSFSITALFYGRSGTGKTTLSCTFPKPLLYVDISEEGTDSVSNVKGIETVPIEEWDDFEELYWFLEDNSDRWVTVLIDAVHPLQALAIRKAKSLNGKNEDDQTSKRDFGTASGLMNQWIINYRDLSRKYGINVIFISHDRIRESEEGEGVDDDTMIIPEVGPNVMPSVASTLTGSVKVVGHTFIRQYKEKIKRAGQKPKIKTEYCLRVGPHGFYTSKIRNPKEVAVPDYLVDPTYDKIVQVIKGEFSDSKTGSSSRKKKKRTSSRKR